MACCRLRGTLLSSIVSYNEQLQGYQIRLRVDRADASCIPTYSNISVGFFKDGFFYRIGYINQNQLGQDITLFISLDDYRDIGFNDSIDNQIELSVKALCRDDGLEYDYGLGGITIKGRNIVIPPPDTKKGCCEVYLSDIFLDVFNGGNDLRIVNRVLYDSNQINCHIPTNIKTIAIITLSDGTVKNIDYDNDFVVLPNRFSYDFIKNISDSDFRKGIKHTEFHSLYYCNKRWHKIGIGDVRFGHHSCDSLKLIVTNVTNDGFSIGVDILNSRSGSDAPFTITKAHLSVFTVDNEGNFSVYQRVDVKDRIPVRNNEARNIILLAGDLGQYTQYDCDSVVLLEYEYVCGGKTYSGSFRHTFPGKEDYFSPYYFYLRSVYNSTGSVTSGRIFETTFEFDFVRNQESTGSANVLTVDGIFQNNDMNLFGPYENVDVNGNRYLPASSSQNVRYFDNVNYPYINFKASTYHPGSLIDMNTPVNELTHSRYHKQSTKNHHVLVFMNNYKDCAIHNTSDKVGVRFAALQPKYMPTESGFRTYARSEVDNIIVVREGNNSAIHLLGSKVSFTVNLPLESGLITHNGAIPNLYLYSALVYDMGDSYGDYVLLGASHEHSSIHYYEAVASKRHDLVVVSSGQKAIFVDNYTPNQIKALAASRRLYLYRELRQLARDSAPLISSRRIDLQDEFVEGVKINPNFAGFMNMVPISENMVEAFS